MEMIRENREAIAWILLWAWIALTIFIFAYTRPKPLKIYIFNLFLLGGFVYLMWLWE